MSSELSKEGENLLTEFAANEDEFDNDLMACGCRYAASPNMKLDPYELIRLFNLDHDKMVALIAALVDEGRIEHNKLFELAGKAATMEIKETDRRAKPKQP